MIAVLNLGISNLTSVLNAFEFLKIDFCVANTPEEFDKASKFILPGVGSFAAGMNALESKRFIEPLKKVVLEEEKPLLGICLGQQLLFESSEESPGIMGLSLIKGNVLKLPENADYDIPRIGWGESVFLKDFLGHKKRDKADFYYIHSFSVQPENFDVVTISTENINIAGAVKQENIYGCQFHPEKSYNAGLKILREFSRL